MQLIEWESNYNLGVNVIDEHHQQLVRLINKSYDAIQLNDRQTVELILEELFEYTNYHLNTEELFMQKYNYQSMDEHGTAHSTFRTKVRELQSKLISNDGLHNIQIVTFLKDWLMDHILVTDKELAGFLISKGLS